MDTSQDSYTKYRNNRPALFRLDLSLLYDDSREYDNNYISK